MARAGTGGLGEADSADAADGLAHNIKVDIGVTASVRVTGVGEIERTMGKAQRIQYKVAGDSSIGYML